MPNLLHKSRYDYEVQDPEYENKQNKQKAIQRIKKNNNNINNSLDLRLYR